MLVHGEHQQTPWASESGSSIQVRNRPWIDLFEKNTRRQKDARRLKPGSFIQRSIILDWQYAEA